MPAQANSFIKIDFSDLKKKYGIVKTLGALNVKSNT